MRFAFFIKKILHRQCFKLVIFQIQNVSFFLGKAVHIFVIHEGFDQRRIQCNNPGIIIFHSVDCPCPQTEDKTQHAGFRVHALLPDECVIR